MGGNQDPSCSNPCKNLNNVGKFIEACRNHLAAHTGKKHLNSQKWFTICWLWRLIGCIAHTRAGAWRPCHGAWRVDLQPSVELAPTRQGLEVCCLEPGQEPRRRQGQEQHAAFVSRLAGCFGCSLVHAVFRYMSSTSCAGRSPS